MFKIMGTKIWLFVQAWAEARAMRDIMMNEYRNRSLQSKETKHV